MPQVRVPGFLPSTSGLHFTNYFPHEPEIQIKLPLGPTLCLGDAANGLCGGMAFVVRDYFEAGQPIPPDTDPPAAGTPLYQFIVRRLLDSFNLPFGLMRYVELMQPSFPDVGPGFGLPGRAASWSATSGRTFRTTSTAAIPSRSVWSKSSPPIRTTCARTTRCWPTATTWTAPT